MKSISTKSQEAASQVAFKCISADCLKQLRDAMNAFTQWMRLYNCINHVLNIKENNSFLQNGGFIQEWRKWLTDFISAY